MKKRRQRQTLTQTRDERSRIAKIASDSNKTQVNHPRANIEHVSCEKVRIEYGRSEYVCRENWKRLEDARKKGKRIKKMCEDQCIPGPTRIKVGRETFLVCHSMWACAVARRKERV